MIELDFYVYNTKFRNKYGKVLFTVLTHLALNLMFRAGWSLFLNFCNKSVINLKICWLHYCSRHNAKKIGIYSPALLKTGCKWLIKKISYEVIKEESKVTDLQHCFKFVSVSPYHFGKMKPRLFAARWWIKLLYLHVT